MTTTLDLSSVQYYLLGGYINLFYHTDIMVNSCFRFEGLLERV